MNFHLGLVLTLGALAATGRAPDVEVTTLDSQQGRGGGRGVVLIRCAARSTNLVLYSRGAILDVGVGGADRDVIVATAHGLPTDLESVVDECRVIGPDNRSYRVERVWRGRAAEAGNEDDWAVLLTKRRLEGDVGRLRVGQVTDDAVARLTSEHAPVRLLMRNPDLPKRNCALSEFASARETVGLMSYSCPSAPGSSGSPIVAGIDGRALLIGIHLGWGFEGESGGRVRVVSVGRAIDAEIAAAITAAAAQAGVASRTSRRNDADGPPR
jgi:hypothetical protein